MIDFIEYVIAELKSKRLSKANAVALVKQFYRRSKGSAAASCIHPLLHSNTSDLSEQRYSSTFSGEEFFLADHQLRIEDGSTQKVLPGVVYLEMARAAVEQAWAERQESSVLELHNTVWAQPIVVNGSRQIHITLRAKDEQQIDYEIYSQQAEQEVVHCQGSAVWSDGSGSAKLDIEQLKAEMTQGQLEPGRLYEVCAQMGLMYGTTMRGIIALHRGKGQVVAQLRMPTQLEEKRREYVLHPSLLDSGLQAAVGLMEGIEKEGVQQARVPFALERLRIVGPCSREMWVWVRYAKGSGAGDKVAKVDIDFCDERGTVCVQMQGFSSRVLSLDVSTSAAQGKAIGGLIAVPVWQASELNAELAGYREHHVIVCELTQVNLEQLESLLGQSQCLSLQRTGGEKDIAQRYSEYALRCLERIQAILQNQPAGKVLVQVVIAEEGEQALLAGLSGLLKTAGLENPQLAGQLILVPAETTTEELVRHLQAEKNSGVDSLVRYEAGVRQVLRWEAVKEEEQPENVLRDAGVYLITGGLGALGLVFAKEILSQTSAARVVLTGRAALSPEKQAQLDGLSAERVSYRQVELADEHQVRELIAAIQQEYGQLNGILHSAGMIRDNFILKKGSGEFGQVLEPKVLGTFNLDLASWDVRLDFFVLFSSLAGALGNLGQADYAAANGFMDQFAAYRNRQVESGERYGLTRSINWGLWQAGGMKIDAATRELVEQRTGMRAMQTATGVKAFYRSLALPHDEMLVVEGERAQLRRALLGEPQTQTRISPDPAAQEQIIAAETHGNGINTDTLLENTQDYLRKQLAGLLKVPSQKIDPRAALENYGIDSILAMQLTNQLEKTFGSLPKTLFFEYQTIRELTDYFIIHYSVQLNALFTAPNNHNKPISPTAPSLRPVQSMQTTRRRSGHLRGAAFTAPTAPIRAKESEPIAIIGLSGRYPEAVNLDAYWRNLREGKDCIVEVPRERWDWREYFSEDRTQSGHHYSKWGGFITGVDEFDPLFFNMSPLEAELIDPQERLFLQQAWMALEDAGYTRAGLQAPQAQDLPGQVGVYVGVMYSEYQLFGAEATARGQRMGVAGSVASIANRVSYVLNLHGPSMTLDTMCSSSLTAIHLACQDLKQGRTNLAIAGGVNVTIHPSKYLVLSFGQFISSDGHCQSFGEGGDGYIPGEGVGVVVLKRLSEAERDGDHIYGIIRGSALNHGGKTNGYTVPNPQAQAAVISRALAEAGVDAGHISYIEAHGTGTKLGDPIEIAALSKAFQNYTEERGFCRIGSAKSNIGHCESAAGIAGLTKVLLQMQHGEIVPSLHAERLNPHIDFGKSPFVVNRELGAWERVEVDGRRVPRIAGISSFGAGGSNAHMIVEEYEEPVAVAAAAMPVAAASMPVAVVLSARTGAQLKEKARELLQFVRGRENSIDLAAMAYTLQVGREAMEERLALEVNSVEQLVEKLEAYVAGEQDIEDAYQGQVKRNQEALSLFRTDADLQQTVEKWLASRKLSKLLELWVKGLEVDWSQLYGENKPRRVSLPTYPFARERYWVEIPKRGQVAGYASATAAVLHPLLHSNTSDLSEQRYSSTFSGDEFFLADHQLRLEDGSTQKVLPGVVYLEMARAAIEQAWAERPESSVLELHNTVWAQPIVVSESRQIHIALRAKDEQQIDYEIYSQQGEQEVVHCQGSAVWSDGAGSAKLDIEQLKAEMTQGQMEPGRLYEICAQMGLLYGTTMRDIIALHRGQGQVVAQLRLPTQLEERSDEYVLHPSLLDSGLQAAVGLMEGIEEEGVQQARVPFALEKMRIVGLCSREMWVWVRYAQGSRAGDKVAKVDIDLCDERGNICVQMQGISSRVLDPELTKLPATQGKAIESLIATPVWQASELNAEHGAGYREHHVIVCELPQVNVEQLGALLEQSQCLFLQCPAGEKDIAQRYSEYALCCFERIQAILQNQPAGKVLVQVVVAGRGEQALLAGLSGLLKTAGLENPQLAGQLILVPAETTTKELVRHLQAEKNSGVDSLVRYEAGVRQVLHWEEISVEAGEPPVAFQEQGVYLITGGLGGLGLVFAKEILEQTHQGRVILTGRSVLTEGKQERLAGLSGEAGRVSYRQVDLADEHQVRELIAAIQQEYGQLNGILHSAGMIRDNFILKKGSGEFGQVLGPKVLGTYSLDQASRDVRLDFFVLFSSLAGALGNLGQADYAAANAFMDQFAAYRNRRVAMGERCGRTRSINWGLWESGGMGVDVAMQELVEQRTGMRAMQTATGVKAFYRSLALPHDQVLVVEGDVSQMNQVFFKAPAVHAEPPAKQPVGATEIDREYLVEKTQEYLRKEFSELLKVPSHKVDPQEPLEKYGIDSILAMQLTNRLEKTFGSLSKTLFFEYQTIADLAEYFVKAHPATVQAKIGLHDEPKEIDARNLAVEKKTETPARRSGSRFVSSNSNKNDQKDIAIVGLSGRYPQAENLQEFWRNLKDGRDCITDIPAERWDNTLYYDPDQNKSGKSYSKWGGFIANVDKFDPLFFNISPKEAALTDPQERLFLETVWETIEDAGYTKQSISGSRTGVFVGVMWGHYELFGAESIFNGNTTIPQSSHASIANRVSYFFNFHGPSIGLDTMCSSSLTAIHLACEELRKGEIDAAIAGGVNLTIHPYKYLSLSQGKFAASDGRCRSFGQGGDGYVPGEGVGAILLKPLENALRDGDQIYAVIKSSTVNHGGKTNGYTVPNPNAQAELILNALKKANINPRTLSYVETHGTGTSLGDPIEIAGLSKAFEGFGEEKQFCPIGSVKSNIGHLESAAGIAALTKALLQIKYRQLVPSLHADPLNPHINFEDSPFYVQTELTEWKRPAAHPRRVGVSSFGAGGSNAHVILEEYIDTRQPVKSSQTAPLEAFVLSAKDHAALCRYAERFVGFLEPPSDISLENLAYTLQVGRTAMDARLVVLASTLEDLRTKLNQWTTLQKKEGVPWADTASDLEGLFCANVKDGRYGVGDLIAGKQGKAFVQDLLAGRDLEKIARLWILGVEIDWSLMQQNTGRKRVSLPTYPFAREKCWIQQEVPVMRVQERAHESKTAVRELAEEKQRTYYSPQWMLKELAVLEEKRSATGPMLILDTSEGLYAAIKEWSSERDPIVLVKPGKSFDEIRPGVYVIDPEQEEQFHALVENLRNSGRLPGVILHSAPEVSALDEKRQVAEQLNNGIYSIFHLCKALMKGKHQAQVRILSVFSNASQVIAPLSAGLGGFFKTLMLENPRYLAKVVGIQDEPETSVELSLLKKVGIIFNELRDQDWTTTEIRYSSYLDEDRHKHARYVCELQQQTPLEKQISPSPLKKYGVYLITGGLGGLGMIFAEQLAKNFQAKLVLVGRSLPNATQDERLNRLKGYGAEVLFVQADVSKLEDMESAVHQAKTRFSAINGVIHAAGVNRDAFILTKTREEMETVLAPKVYGTINVDQATSGENLDLFVLFSSIAGVTGNFGQCDYAYGNHFLDVFAEYREHLRKIQKRSGRTLSINWPLWEEGGMRISQADVALLDERTGICPLPTQEGIQYWEEFLQSEAVQAVALYGRASRIAAHVTRKPLRSHRSAAAGAEGIDSAMLFARTETYLKTLIGEEINLAPERVGSLDPLESFGIDSVMINRFNARLEKDLGALPKTLLYEHETVAEVAKFLLQEVREELTVLFSLTGADEESAIPQANVEKKDAIQDEVSRAEKSDDLEPIAIIGIHGYYPHSATLDEYWENLKQGSDLIDLVPPDRWNYAEFYDPDPGAASDGKIYCKWGGFLDDYDKFDPDFFDISAEEAKIIDPQERLFLESVWAAIEDAGYTRDSLKERFCKGRSADLGVYVGVTTNSYHLVGSEESSRGSIGRPSALPWSIANRVSYFFDFNGPSMPVDTACSSSLVAVHLACENLRNRECQVAIAGGVNLYLHPSKYQSLCRRRMLSRDGKCHSYGAGDDGFVPGEGVGTLVLKPLSQAISDQDRIYAVIRGSAFSHSGRSNGYTAPNPNSQAYLISRACKQAGIHPESISCVEGHGTGTQLGDSLELAALTQAFQQQTDKIQFCSIGSVKANIGHSESAAGMASMAKVILQMKHQQLVPSIYSDQENPDIEFKESPFYLQHTLSDWKPSSGPRRALINSFGAGGVNACMILEEYQNPDLQDDLRKSHGPCLFTLSARNEDRLREYVNRILIHLRKGPAVDLASLCYTLQVGREGMEERLATVVADVNELIDRLSAWSKRGSSDNIYRGSLGRRRGLKRSSRSAKIVMEKPDLFELASLWIAGQEVDWTTLYSGHQARRILLPTYPFARERYWVSDSLVPDKPTSSMPQLHPLISYNSSTLKEVSFSSSLSDTAFYAIDHRVNEEAIFPGAGFLEIACIAGNIANEERVARIQDIVWIQPFSFQKGPHTLRTLLKHNGDNVEYAISSLNEENEPVFHSEGRLVFRSGCAAHPSDAEDRIPIEALKAQCIRSENGAVYYNELRKHGLNYGRSFQTIQEIHVGASFALSKLKIADHLKGDFGQFILHPTMIDGALQTVAGLVGSLELMTPHLPFALDEVDILHPIRQTCYAYAEFADLGERSRSGVRKFNIQLMNESGDVLIRLKNLYVRSFTQPAMGSRAATAASI